MPKDEWVLSNVHITSDSDEREPHFRNSKFTIKGYSQPLIIQHQMATPLDQVGKQVWMGAILLADFLIYGKELLKDRVLLELGSGTGFIASLLSSKAFGIKHFYATDIHDILMICKENIERNGGQNVSVFELDLMKNHLERLKTLELWHTDGDLIIASDILYQDELTFALVSSMYSLLEPNAIGTPRTLIMSMEKRIQFCIHRQSICAPAYDYFFDTLKALNIQREAEGKTVIIAQEIDTELIPQHFEFERSQYLCLWKFFSS
jgi:predicted nicotinamide N-methyase